MRDVLMLGWYEATPDAAIILSVASNIDFVQHMNWPPITNEYRTEQTQTQPKLVTFRDCGYRLDTHPDTPLWTEDGKPPTIVRTR